MASSRFASLEGSIETFIEEQENQNTVKKTKRDVALFTKFLLPYACFSVARYSLVALAWKRSQVKSIDRSMGPLTLFKKL